MNSQLLSIDLDSDSGLGILAALFLSLKPIESFLDCVFGIIVFLKLSPLFYLYHPGKWLQNFIKNVLAHFSIHPYFSCMNRASDECLKTAAPPFFHVFKT